MSIPIEETEGQRLSRVTGEFCDERQEREFRAAQQGDTVTSARFIFMLGVAVSTVFLAVNLVMLPGEPPLSALLPRVFAIVASLACVFAIRWIKPKYAEMLLLFWVGAITFSSAGMVSVQTEVSIISILVLPAMFYLVFPTNYRLTLLAGIGSSIAMFAAYADTMPPIVEEARIAIAMLLMNGLLFIVYGRMSRRLRQTWALAQSYRKAMADLADSRQLLESTFMSVPVPLVVSAGDTGIITRANEAAEKFLKVPSGELVGRNASDFYRSSNRKAEFEETISRDGVVRDHPVLATLSDGEARSVLISASTLHLGDGETPSIVAGAVDITEQKARERQLRAAEKEFRMLFENAAVGIYRSTPEGKMLRANPALVRLNGYDSEQELVAAVNNISLEWYVQPGRREEWLRLMHEHGRVTDFVSEVYRHKTRERIWIAESSWTVFAGRKPAYYEGMLIEATDRKRLEEKIEHMAGHDQLTDLANRRLLMERLEQACSWVSRHGGYFAIMCLDLDRFKAVNDAFGHATGDLLLAEAAKRLKSVCRAEDTIARMGGDEFTILSVGIGHPDRLAVAAERILKAFEEPFVLDGPRAAVGISIGIAVAPIDGTDPKDLLAKADQALYRAKAEGRNCHRFFNEEALPLGRKGAVALAPGKAG